MTQHEDQAATFEHCESSFAAAGIRTDADTILSQDIFGSSTLSDSDPGSSKINKDIASNQEIVFLSTSGKFDVPSSPQFQDSRFISSSRVHPARTAKTPILPKQ